MKDEQKSEDTSISQSVSIAPRLFHRLHNAETKKGTNL